MVGALLKMKIKPIAPHMHVTAAGRLPTGLGGGGIRGHNHGIYTQKTSMKQIKNILYENVQWCCKKQRNKSLISNNEYCI